MITEKEVIAHVQRYAKFIPRFAETTPYHVHWQGESFWSNDTRDLVVQICKKEGILVK